MSASTLSAPTPQDRILTAGALFLIIAALAGMTACLGLSSSGSGPAQNQVSTLSLAAANLNFGDVAVGANKTLSVSASNSGPLAVTISSAAVSSKYFSVTAPTLPVTISSGQSASFNVMFSPNAAGSFSGNVTVNSDASNAAATLSLAGTGTSGGQLALNPASEAFGSVPVGSSQSQTITLTNSGGSVVNISSASVSGAGFQITGITPPLTLNSQQSTSFTLSFAPQSAGNASGTVTIASDASNSNLAMAVTGTGVTAGALGSNPTSLAFGSVTVGTNQNLSETVTNTGGTSVTISSAAVSGAGLSLSGITPPVTLGGGKSATFTVSFDPQSAGAISGSVTVTSNATNSTLKIPVAGTGVSAGSLGGNPTSLAFGSVTVGSSETLSETVTNNGGTSVTISQAGISGSGFSLNGISPPLTLSSGQSTSFSVVFAPKSAGGASGSVTLSSNASNPNLSIPLTATGAAAIGQLSASPGTLAIGNVVVGTSGKANGTLSASGANVTVTGASTNNSAFSVGGLSLPITIPAGQSTSFSVTFSPQTAATASATLTFTSNAQPSTTTETLTGTGTPAPTHTVNLSWSASTSSNISGYNIYRSTYVSSTCGSFAKINSTLNTTTLYSDNAVTDGTSYCYATTAVDSSSQESGYSNVVSNVQIPAP